MRAAILAAALLGAHGSLHAQYAPEVRGRVVDAVSGLAVEGADLRLGNGARIRSGADGSFILRALQPGTVVLEARAIGYAPAHEPLDLANGTTSMVTLALVPVPVELAPIAVRADADLPAAGVTRIERDAIEASAALDLGELLQREAGAVVVRTGGPGSPATISLRGSSSNQVLVLQDGVPLNQATTGGTDLSQVRLDQVERVTILRGAQSARYGARALGGAIAIETRRPSSTQARVGGTAGSYGTRAVDARLGTGGTGAWSAAAGGEWSRFGGDFPYAVPPERGGGSATRLNTDATDIAADASLAWNATGSGVRLRGEFFDMDRGMPGTVMQPSLTARQQQQRFSVGLDGHWSRGATAGTASLVVQRQQAHFSDPAPPLTRPYDERNRATTVQALADASRRAGPGMLAVGGEVRRVAITATTLAPGAPEATTYAGAWATLAVPLVATASTDLRLTTGARIDRNPVGSGTFLSPEAGVALRHDWWQAQVRWARAFSPPSLADLYFQEGVRVEPNPALAPERVPGEWTVALAAHDIPLGPLTGEASLDLFQGDIDGMILWSPDFQFIWSPANFDVRRRGGELGLRLAPRRGGLRLSGAIALSDVQYRGPVLQGQVIYRPRWSAVANADAPVLGFVAGASWRYLGERRTSVGTDLNALAPLHLLDLRITRALALGPMGLEVRAVLENVLNATTGMLPDFPLPGRMFRLSLGLTHARNQETAPDVAPH